MILFRLWNPFPALLIFCLHTFLKRLLQLSPIMTSIINSYLVNGRVPDTLNMLNYDHSWKSIILIIILWISMEIFYFKSLAWAFLVFLIIFGLVSVSDTVLNLRCWRLTFYSWLWLSCILILLGVSAAFDTLDHVAWFQGSVLVWFTSYLKEKTFLLK